MAGCAGWCLWRCGDLRVVFGGSGARDAAEAFLAVLLDYPVPGWGAALATKSSWRYQHCRKQIGSSQSDPSTRPSPAACKSAIRGSRMAL